MSFGSSCLNIETFAANCTFFFFFMCLLEKYCGLGLKVEKLIETSDHKATVQFRSGTHHTGRGFYLSYSTTDHPGTPLVSPSGAPFKSCLLCCLCSWRSLEKFAHSFAFKACPGNTCILKCTCLFIRSVHAGFMCN